MSLVYLFQDRKEIQHHANGSVLRSIGEKTGTLNGIDCYESINVVQDGRIYRIEACRLPGNKPAAVRVWNMEGHHWIGLATPKQIDDRDGQPRWESYRPIRSRGEHIPEQRIECPKREMQYV